MQKMLKYKLEILLIAILAIGGFFFYQKETQSPVGEHEGEVLYQIKTQQFVFGRTDADIMSVRTHTFTQPETIEIERQDVDAPSSILIFSENGQEIFSVTVYDHTSVAIFAADPENFIQMGGHTVMINPAPYPDHPAVQMYRDTLEIK